LPSSLFFCSRLLSCLSHSLLYFPTFIHLPYCFIFFFVSSSLPYSLTNKKSLFMPFFFAAFFFS
jgi:hypothetical protein